MVASMQVRADGLSRVEQRLGTLAHQMGDLSELMDRFGLYLEASTIDRFDDETAPDGTPWKPSIRARETGGKTLTDKGLLRGSITYVAGPDQVEWGSNLIYAAVHQHGATIEPVNAPHLRFRMPGGSWVTSDRVEIPARSFLGVSGEDEAQLLGLAEDYVLEAAGGTA